MIFKTRADNDVKFSLQMSGQIKFFGAAKILVFSFNVRENFVSDSVITYSIIFTTALKPSTLLANTHLQTAERLNCFKGNYQHGGL